MLKGLFFFILTVLILRAIAPGIALDLLEILSKVIEIINYFLDQALGLLP